MASLLIHEEPTVYKLIMKEKLVFAVCGQLEIYEIKSFIHRNRAAYLIKYKRFNFERGIQCNHDNVCFLWKVLLQTENTDSAYRVKHVNE